MPVLYQYQKHINSSFPYTRVVSKIGDTSPTLISTICQDRQQVFLHQHKNLGNSNDGKKFGQATGIQIQINCSRGSEGEGKPRRIQTKKNFHPWKLHYPTCKENQSTGTKTHCMLKRSERSITKYLGVLWDEKFLNVCHRSDDVLVLRACLTRSLLAPAIAVATLNPKPLKKKKNQVSTITCIITVHFLQSTRTTRRTARRANCCPCKHYCLPSFKNPHNWQMKSNSVPLPWIKTQITKTWVFLHTTDFVVGSWVDAQPSGEHFLVLFLSTQPAFHP